MIKKTETIMTSRLIKIRGARHHNLKNIDLDLPRNRLIVVTGLSGSGKSTLAFDILYAEGQRRYVESLSTYARQFLERMQKPEVDRIDGLSPAIAIEQKSSIHNPRSTVGTITEIYDFLRLLYARIGRPHCHQCGQPIKSQTLDQFIDQILALEEGTRLIIFAPMALPSSISLAEQIRRLRREGFARIRLGGVIYEIDEIPTRHDQSLQSMEVVVDRLIVRSNIRNRLADSLELALSLSEDRILVEEIDGPGYIFSEKAVCPVCNIGHPVFTPASFSFNSPHGACHACDGLGVTTAFDLNRIVPDPSLSLREGAVVPWSHRHSVHFNEFMEALTAHYGSDIYTPFENLPEPFQKVLFDGSGDEEITFFFEKNRRHTYRKTFEGVIPYLERRYRESESTAARREIRRYMRDQPCQACHGTRLNPYASAVRVGDITIADFCSRSAAAALSFVKDLSLTGQDQFIAEKILIDIQNRLQFIVDVGLPYLTLNRRATTLSGGESQRIRLATQIGSKLTGVLYVLDEPSIGLHPRDNQRLLNSLKAMRDAGNTVLVVEHDAETILSADHVVDMGPGAGIHGGEIVFTGDPGSLMAAKHSLTADYLANRKQIPCPPQRRTGNGHALLLEGASQNNLDHINVRFPLGCFICITGVSGSGKSTLILETLYPALLQKLYRSGVAPGKHQNLQGARHLDKVVHIDQSPIGKTPRSNPSTYSGVFTLIRELFARTPEARSRGYKPSRFSFNIKGGRCEACRGDGTIKIEMHFLPDIYVICDACRGQRYNRETLEIKYRGLTIVDVLDMTANQAYRFFSRMRNIRNKLETLIDVGLGYIRLGQSAITLSGGEAQRVKLAKELSRKDTGRTIYILDEPTTGLHFEDTRKLLEVLHRLVDAGNTAIVIEHNMDLVKTADYIIDLGPEGGDAGGRVVGCGEPEVFLKTTGSHTAYYLSRVLAKSRP
jgi:excinuclease ABC subunit A